jgi:hypothetical protein
VAQHRFSPGKAAFIVYRGKDTPLETKVEEQAFIPEVEAVRVLGGDSGILRDHCVADMNKAGAKGPLCE